MRSVDYDWSVSDFFLDSEDSGGIKKPARNSNSSQYSQLATEMLANERYLSGPERAFLEKVAANQEADLVRLREIAANHGYYL